MPSKACCCPLARIALSDTDRSLPSGRVKGAEYLESSCARGQDGRKRLTNEVRQRELPHEHGTRNLPRVSPNRSHRRMIDIIGRCRLSRYSAFSRTGQSYGRFQFPPSAVKVHSLFEEFSFCLNPNPRQPSDHFDRPSIQLACFEPFVRADNEQALPISLMKSTSSQHVRLYPRRRSAHDRGTCSTRDQTGGKQTRLGSSSVLWVRRATPNQVQPETSGCRR